jgi:hypothetical protein
VQSTPGVFLRRHADYLLLEVAVTNDTREEAGREDEIYRTLRGALTAAERSKEVDISVVDPHQYRGHIIKLVAGDIDQVTSTLGAEYRVVVGGIDRPVEWFRLGLLDLGLFIPYRYTVIPQSITSVATDEC